MHVDRSPVALTGVLCLSLALTLVGSFAFPALLPSLIRDWHLSNTQAGWIAGIYLGGYAGAVVVLVSLTDRVDGRLVFVGGALLSALSLAGFALAAQGFWTALLFRLLGGIGLAGSYMPGLRALIDRYDGPGQARALSFYTASFSLGTALSFLVAGEVERAWGWPAAFGVAAVAAAVAALLVGFALAPITPHRAQHDGSVFDVRPVLRNRAAMGYVIGYGLHAWELFGMRSWQVVFLVFCLGAAGTQGAGWFTPTTVATLGGLLATFASIGGQEVAVRLGRRRVISAFMIISALVSCGVGFGAAWPYLVAVALILLYSVTTIADSAALTAGAVQAAEAGRRGTTLAVHSLIGFGGGFLGPVAMGWVLDLTGGGTTVLSWGLAFASLGAVAALGPLGFWLLRPNRP